MHIHIKICGFTEPVGLQAALDAGVDSIGLVLDPSPRQLTMEQAVALAKPWAERLQVRMPLVA